MQERTVAAVGRMESLARRAREHFSSEATLPVEHRLEKLRSLDAAIRAHEGQLLSALEADLGRCVYEGYVLEVGVVLEELKVMRKHLRSWLKPRRLGLPLVLWPGQGLQYLDPLGAALIIAPWNYPVLLALSPVVGAIASGCTAVLKPSELSPRCAEVLESVLTSAFGDQGPVWVAQGGPEEARELLAQRWDLLFFTGSTRVGQVVMEAAAKHLTPCVLELGGKSPCLVDESCDVEVTARRIIWGKMSNAGQTCIAPDYVLVAAAKKAPLLEALTRSVKAMYGEDPAQSPDFGRIVNHRHFDRLAALLKGGRVVVGGQVDREKRFIAPTVLVDVDLGHPLMQEEIFGPLLPVIEVPDMAAAIDFVRARPKPLALYVFTSRAEVGESVLRRTSSGQAVVNDVVIQAGAHTLPFGGVGPSGIGAYHGQASIEAFSHRKSVVKKPFLLDLKIRYPPYPKDLRLARRVLG